MSRDSFRRAVTGGVGEHQDVVEVVVKLRPGWSVLSWWALYRLAHPPAWLGCRPLLGVGVSGPFRSDERPFTWEVVFTGVSESICRWLVEWLRDAPEDLLGSFCLETAEGGEVCG